MQRVGGPVVPSYNPDLPTLIHTLPHELLRCYIFPMTPLENMKVLTLVCKKWNTVYNQPETIKNIIKRYFRSYEPEEPGDKIDLQLRRKFIDLIRFNVLLKTHPFEQEMLEHHFTLRTFQRIEKGMIQLVKHESKRWIRLTESQRSMEFEFRGSTIMSMHFYQGKFYLGTHSGVIHSLLLSGNATCNNKLFTSFVDKPIEQLKVCGPCIYYVHSMDSIVRRYLKEEGSLLDPLGKQVDSQVSCFEIASSRLFIGYANGTVEFYNLKNPDPEAAALILKGTSKVSCMQVVDHTLFVGHDNGTVDFWDLKTLAHTGLKIRNNSDKPEYRITCMAVYESWLFIGGSTSSGEGFVKYLVYPNDHEVRHTAFNSPVTQLVFDSGHLYVNNEVGLVHCDLSMSKIDKVENVAAIPPPPLPLPIIPHPPDAVRPSRLQRIKNVIKSKFSLPKPHSK